MHECAACFRKSPRCRLLALALVCLGTAAACQSEPGANELFPQARKEYRKKDYTKAHQLVNQAFTSDSLDPASRLAWRLRILRAEILQEQGDFEQAETVLQQIESYLPEGRFKALDVRILMLRGSLSDPDQNKGYLEQARSKALALADLDLLSEIERLESFRLWSLGQPLEAIAASRPISDRNRDKVECFHIARAYNNLAYFHLRLEQWDESRNWAQFALPCARELADDIPRALAVTLLNMGTTENRLGRLDDAQAHLEEALGLAGSDDLPEVLLELGNNFFFRRNWEAAAAQYEQGLESERQQEDKLTFVRNLASTWTEAGNCEKAERYANEAKQIAGPDPDQQEAVRSILNQARLEAMCGDPNNARGQLSEALGLSGDYPDLRWRIYFSLADLLAEQGEWEEAYLSFENALEIIDQANQALPDEGDRMNLFSSLIGIHRSYVHALIQGSRQGRALEVADASRARLLREQLGAPVQRGQIGDFQRAAAQSDRAFLSYWLSQLGCYLWVITPSETHFIELEAEVSEIRRLVDEFQARLEEGEGLKVLRPAGAKLFEILVRPALDHLPAQPRVMIVADDVLHQLSFEALPVKGQGSPHPWIKDATISMAPSLGAIAAQPAAAKISLASALLIAVPDAPEYEELKAAKDEVDEIERRLKPLASAPGKVHRLPPRQANPDAFMKANHQASLFHFAAHAESNSTSPLSSAILLNPWRGVHKLYARDIQRLDLNAQLVTLSACQTVGEAVFSGEGPVGFAWAFLSRGSWNVVASQWYASDEATAEIMVSLYEHLIANQGRSPDRALRQAKLDYLRTHEDARPYFWAPFQIYTRRMVH